MHADTFGLSFSFASALALSLAASCPVPAAEPAPAAAGSAGAGAPAEQGSGAGILDKVSATPYGFIQLAASYDRGNVFTGNYACWAVDGEGEQWNATANASRIGLDLKGPEFETVKASGRFEMDLFGGGAENKPLPMLRHAYVEVEWPGTGISLLAGQTWDLVGPLNPRVINYSVQWWAGNIGYRRPQLRFSAALSPSPRVKFRAQACLARTIGDTGWSAPQDPGPLTAQARVSLGIAISSADPDAGRAEKRIEIGLSGHYADEKYGDRYFPTWSSCLDVTIDLPAYITLKGEFWQGANLDAYLGAIGQGIALDYSMSPIQRHSIDAVGGWFAVEAGPWKGFRLTLGASVDDPVNDDLINDTDRARNEAYFVTAMHDICKGVTVGLEVSWWKTRYLREPARENWRGAAMVQYGF